MARGYMLDKSYLDILAEMVRWWRGNRYWFLDRRGPVRQPVPFQLARFELTEDLAPGESAAAIRIVPDGVGTWRDADPEQTATIRDQLGTTRGKARTDSLDGTRVLAVKAHDHADWEIVQAQGWPLMIRGQLTAALATTDATFTIDGVTVLQPVGCIAAGHIIDGSNEVTVYNIFNWEGDDDGEVVAVWNEYADRWEAIQVECPA
jgi:hypothetical protein